MFFSKSSDKPEIKTIKLDPKIKKSIPCIYELIIEYNDGSQRVEELTAEQAMKTYYDYIKKDEKILATFASTPSLYEECVKLLTEIELENQVPTETQSSSLSL